MFIFSCLNEFLIFLFGLCIIIFFFFGLYIFANVWRFSYYILVIGFQFNSILVKEHTLMISIILDLFNFVLCPRLWSFDIFLNIYIYIK